MAGWLVGLIPWRNDCSGALVTVIAGAYFATALLLRDQAIQRDSPQLCHQGNPLSATTPVVAASNVTPFLTIQVFLTMSDVSR